MADRATNKQLEALCDEINRLTGSPVARYAKDESGRYCPQVGNYHLDGAYGGWNLARMVNESGGITHPLGGGYRTKRELRDQMRAFIDGLRAASAA